MGFTVSIDRSDPIGEAHFPLFPCTRSSAGILGQWYTRRAARKFVAFLPLPAPPSPPSWPFVRLLARSPSLRRGANKIEGTHERRSHEACVRACLPRVSARERVSWVDGDGDVWGIARFQIFEQIQVTNSRNESSFSSDNLLRKIDNYGLVWLIGTKDNCQEV